MSVSQLLELPDELRRDAMNAERDQLIEIHVLVPAFFQLLHPLRGGSMNPHGDEFVRVRLIARLAQCVNHFRCHAVNAKSNQFVAVRNVQPRRANPRNELRGHSMDAEGNELVTIEGAQTRRTNAANELRRHSMDAERNELVTIEGAQTRRTNAGDELRAHTVNPESDELVRVQSLQILGFYLSGELQADIVDGHRKLLVAVYFFKSQRLHLLRILCVRQEMKETGAFPVVKKPFAFEFSGVARDREMNFLSSGLREIQTRKLARGPVRTVMEVMPAAGIHQREFNFPLNVRPSDGPVATLRLSAPRLATPNTIPAIARMRTMDRCCFMGYHPSPSSSRRSENIGVLERHEFVQRQVLKS